MHEMYVLRTTRNRFCPWAIKFTSRDLFHLLLGIIYYRSLQNLYKFNFILSILYNSKKCVKSKLTLSTFFFHFANNEEMPWCLNFLTTMLQTKEKDYKINRVIITVNLVTLTW